MSKIQAPPTEWKSAKWWRNRSLEERIAWAHIPARWIDMDMRLHNPAATEWVAEFNPKCAGALVCGARQAGKTTTAIKMMTSVMADHQLSGRFVSSDRYVEMLKDQFDNDNQLPEMYAMPHLIKYIKGVFDVVVLDGLGEERLTEFAQHELGSLLRQRYEDCRSTIITTSLTSSDLVKRYGQRISGVIGDMPRLELKYAGK